MVKHTQSKMVKRTQGMNWIRKEKRLALYLRDGLACVYCGEGIEQGATLTLDHLTPYSNGGSNCSHNLVTACRRCNSSRGTRSVRAFSKAVAGYIVEDANEIERHVRNCAKRAIDVAAATKVIESRGGWGQALQITTEEQASK